MISEPVTEPLAEGHTGLSPAQLDIYIDQAIHPDLPLYNIGGYVALNEALDCAAFNAAYDAEMARHDAFRLCFSLAGGQPVQSAAAPLPALELLDFSVGSDPAGEARAWLEALFQRNFELASGPLHHSALLKIAPGCYWYCAVAHHLIIDGFGFSLWVRKLVAAYLALTGRAPAVPAPDGSFLDSLGVRSARRGAKAGRKSAAPPVWPAPLLEARAADARPARSVRVVRDLSPARLERLSGFAQAHGFDIHHLLMALLFMHFFLLKQRDRWTIGLPSHNRRGVEKGLIGSYVAVSPCVLAAGPDDDVRAVMAMIKRALKECVRNQDLSVTELVRAANADGVRSGRLFDVQFNYLKLDYQSNVDSLDSATHYLANCWAQTPLSVNVCEFGSHQPTQLQVDANQAWFSAAQAEAVLDRIEHLADQVMADSTLPLRALALLSAGESRRLAELGRAASVHAPHQDLAARFALVCEHAPHAAALRLGAHTLSYAELHARALRLAHWIQRHDSRTQAPLALCMQPSIDTYVALVAAALLRRAALQLDPGYPAQRLQAMLADAAPGLVITDADGAASLQGLPHVLLNLADVALADAVAAMPASALAPAPARDLAHIPAWIIYTSGSTGTPKGVVLPQAAILRLATQPNFMRLDAATVWLQASNLAFDMATYEIWGTLLNGGTLVLPAQRQFDLDALTRTVQECGVNTLWLTAGLFDKWVARLSELPACLEFVMAGGDVVPPAAVHKLLALRPGVTFINGYGPTENGVFSACAVLTRPEQVGHALAIGKPVNGTSLYVVGPAGRLQPPGEEGELWVGGSGLALGYLNQPALTGAKFVDAPGPDIGERVYRTGDRVRWDAHGQLEFLGRIDAQVKIRGFRIELEEIEHCLRGQAGVTEAAVVALGEEAAGKQLHAFVCCAAADRATLAGALAQRMRAALPDYMVPAQMHFIDALPLNANGKIDRKALGRSVPAGQAQAAGSAPRNGIEAALWSIWQEVLGAAPASVEANFFSCGGHSLAAMQIVADINARFGSALTVGDAMRHPSIAEQAALLDAAIGAAPAPAPPLAPTARPDAIPLSFVQQQMWLSHRLAGGSHEYNVPGAFRVRGPLDRTALQAALRDLAARHQVLACTVEASDAGACLRAADPARIVLGWRDLSTLDAAAREAEVDAALRAERRRSFDLERELPLRACGLTLADQQHVLLLTFHHIAVDGWSLATICTELGALYRARRAGAEADMAPLALAYHDFALHQQALAAGEAAARATRYWRACLDGAPAAHELPLDHPRPEQAGSDGRVLRAVLEPHAAAGLERLAASLGVTLFTVLQTALAMLVGEYSRQRDVLIGTPVSGRHAPALYPLVGCFINTVVTRTTYQGSDSVAALLVANQRNWSDSLAHHDLPFAHVLEAVAPAQSRSISPLFQLWFVLQGRQAGRLELDGLELEQLRGDEASTKFDLMVAALPDGDALEIEWLYREQLFAPHSMTRLRDAYLALLRALPGLLDVPVQALAARLQLAGAPLATPMATSYDPAESVAERVLGHAARTPAALALTDGALELSYAELAEQVRRLAALLAESGVGTGDCVALCADRSIGGVIGLLAIQLLGAAYLPVDPKLPSARIAFMLDDCGASVLLTYQELMDSLPTSGTDIVLLDGAGGAGWLDDYAGAAPPAQGGAATPACVIYTSGSSGTPKGVRVARANLAHYLNAMAERHGVGVPLRHAVNSAFHTDLGNTTLYLGLWFGGSLHLMAPQMMLDGEAVGAYVARQRIDVMKITPGHFAALCDGGLCPPPVPARALIFGGEVLRRELLQAIAPACRARGCAVINHYGPTEATIGCLTHAIDLDAPPAVAPLGLPLPGEFVQVMAEGAPVPLGAWGELVVGGPAVTLGYHKREQLTATAFVELAGPDGAPVRCYRTGDRVRINHAGLVEFGGRFDHQIKLRGFRIELSEIDSCLLRVAGVRQAVTIVVQDGAGQDVLASFVIAQPYDGAALDAAVRAALPEYMLPKRIIGLERMPLLGNGKPDRRALAAQLAEQAEAAYEAPATPTEIGIARVMCDLLKLERLSADQRFFDAGGNSLLVTRLANELAARMQLRIPVNLLMANHSVRSLAELAEALYVTTTPQAHAGELVEIDI